MRLWDDQPPELARLFDIYSRMEVAQFLGSAPRPMTDPASAAGVVARWRDLSATSGGRRGIWAIHDRQTGVVHGSVLLNLMANSDGSPPDVLEVGWHLHPDSWGHGFATEAATGALRYTFARGEPEVHAVVHPRNVKSLAVCRRLGMAPLGHTDRWYGVPLEAFRLAAS